MSTVLDSENLGLSEEANQAIARAIEKINKDTEEAVSMLSRGYLPLYGGMPEICRTCKFKSKTLTAELYYLGEQTVDENGYEVSVPADEDDEERFLVSAVSFCLKPIKCLDYKKSPRYSGIDESARYTVIDAIDKDTNTVYPEAKVLNINHEELSKRVNLIDEKDLPF